jgi:hypothetical protein
MLVFEYKLPGEHGFAGLALLLTTHVAAFGLVVNRE